MKTVRSVVTFVFYDYKVSAQQIKDRVDVLIAGASYGVPGAMFTEAEGFHDIEQHWVAEAEDQTLSDKTIRVILTFQFDEQKIAGDRIRELVDAMLMREFADLEDVHQHWVGERLEDYPVRGSAQQPLPPRGPQRKGSLH